MRSLGFALNVLKFQGLELMGEQVLYLPRQLLQLFGVWGLDLRLLKGYEHRVQG